MIPVTVLEKVKRIHFVGIGGIGMSGLAEYYLKERHWVSGSDLQETSITERLRSLGAEVQIGHKPENVNDKTELVVYTSAAGKDNPELIRAAELNIKIVKRAELLGEVVNGKYLIAVAGTHGKTTTTAMLGKILTDAGLDPIVFVGGSVQQFNGGAFRLGRGKYAVVEADEYDRSFLTLRPNIAVITSIDEDHLDIYKNLSNIKSTFKQFLGNSKENYKLVYCGDDKNIKNIVKSISCEKISYGFNNDNSLKIQSYETENEGVRFSINNSVSTYHNIKLNVIGRHNVLNSTACFAISKLLGISFENFKESMGKFASVERRLQLKYDRNEIKVYDDYAHHPAEIKPSLRSLREIYKNSRIVSVFQPHLYSRTKDFYKQFASELAIADKVVLLEIYPAREEPMAGVTSKLIFDKLIKIKPDTVYITEKEKTVDYLMEKTKSGDVVVFQGAGDITNLCDDFILKLLEKKN